MKRLLIISLFMIPCNLAKGQDMLSGLADSMAISEKVTGAFKSTRVINAHSIEMLSKRNLDFRIMHRFGFVSDGIKQLFGLDAASMRMSFDYGITNNLTLGIGRSTFRKELDAFVKTRILQQTKGENSIPVSIVLAAGTTVWTEPVFTPEKASFSDRSAYYFQFIAGRKFNSAFSLQISPIIVHSNKPLSQEDDKTIFALGGGGRFKLSKRTALTFDYHHPFGHQNTSFTDPLSIGVDIETGGHVFQLQFSNATGMNERAFITQTTGQFFEGDIRFGFNLSRMFQLGKKTGNDKSLKF